MTARAAPTNDGPPALGFELLTYNVAGLPALLSGSEPAVNMPLNGPRLNAYDLDLAEHEHESASLPALLGTDPDRHRPCSAMVSTASVTSRSPPWSVNAGRRAGMRQPTASR